MFFLGLSVTYRLGFDSSILGDIPDEINEIRRFPYSGRLNMEIMAILTPQKSCASHVCDSSVRNSRVPFRLQ